MCGNPFVQRILNNVTSQGSVLGPFLLTFSTAELSPDVIQIVLQF